MFTMNLDGFQFAFYGFATLAASVGYAWRRNKTSRPPSHDAEDQNGANIAKATNVPSAPHPKRVPSHEDSAAPASQHPSTLESESMISELADSTLRKRKFSEDDAFLQEDDTDPSSIYPNKRNKTPPGTDREQGGTPLADEPLTLEAPPPRPDQAVTSKQVCDQTELGSGNEKYVVPISEPVITSSAPIPPLPASQPITRPSTPAAKSVNQSKLLASGGFASFAKADSSFSVATKPAVSSPVANGRPVWKGGAETVLVGSTHPLAAETIQETTYTHLTGEENEIVESGLKGVKLFIKHGSRDFTDGIIGHVKLLSCKDSESTRLLFRREPLWQVTMNVRLSPLVRCSFDEESQALRIITKEPVERANTPIEQWPQQLVIYVMKRGRVPKDVFRKFAEELLASKSLQRVTS